MVIVTVLLAKVYPGPLHVVYCIYIYFFSLIDTTRSLYLGHWHSQFFSQDIGSIFWFLSDDSAHSILSSDISPSRTF